MIWSDEDEKRVSNNRFPFGKFMRIIGNWSKSSTRDSVCEGDDFR